MQFPLADGGDITDGISEAGAEQLDAAVSALSAEQVLATVHESVMEGIITTTTTITPPVPSSGTGGSVPGQQQQTSNGGNQPPSSSTPPEGGAQPGGTNGQDNMEEDTHNGGSDTEEDKPKVLEDSTVDIGASGLAWTSER